MSAADPHQNLPTMSAAMDRFIHGPVTTQVTGSISKTRVSNRAKATQARSKGVALKKAVNSFVMFRSMMSPIFPDWKQSERSRFIRSMWGYEQHKNVWSVIARVWTFIRDNSNYRLLDQYLVGATSVCNLVDPHAWLQLYNCILVRAPDGTAQLFQTAPPAAGAIRAPFAIGDVELLRRLIERGLPVEKPRQLLAQIIDHRQHVLNFNATQDFSTNDETLARPGREFSEFTDQLNYNPVASFAEMLQFEPNSMIFDNGVNIVDVEDVTNFDQSLVLSSGPQTQRRFNWDTTTVHHAQPTDGSIDPVMFEQCTRIYDLDQPNIWDGLTGQTNERDWEAANGKGDEFDMENYLVPLVFDDGVEPFVLQ